MVVTGFSEVASLYTGASFVTILANQNFYYDTFYVKIFPEQIIAGPPHVNALIIASVGFALSSLLTSIISLTRLRLSERFAASLGTDFAKEAFLKTISQPYLTIINRNKSNLTNTLSKEVSHTVKSIKVFFGLIASTINALFVFITLCTISLYISLSMAISISFLYFTLSALIKKNLTKISKIRSSRSARHIRIINEVMSGIRDVIIGNTQDFHTSTFSKADGRMRQAVASGRLLAAFPKFIFNALSIVCISIATIALALKGGSFEPYLPTLAAMVLGVRRLLPNFQRIYNAFATIRLRTAAVNSVIQLLEQKVPVDNSSNKIDFNFENLVHLENIGFHYPQKDWVFRNISMKIHKGERIGIVGDSGSGKSTFIDLLMGLIPPVEGKIIIDNQSLYQKEIMLLKYWKRMISHVPQRVFIADASIEENIALGIKPNKIDRALVCRVAKIVDLEEFILTLRDSYQTIVGEEGVLLSGGQRQRLGIARALYSDFEVLMLDEATSALDLKTERLVINNIISEFQSSTIFIVSHRESTLRDCDRIISISEGRIDSMSN